MNHKQLNKQGYVLDIKKITTEQHKKAIDDLTVSPKTHPDYSKGPISFPLYKIDDANLIIPRYYGIKNFGVPSKTVGLNGEKKNFKFIKQLRPNQVLIADECIEKIKKQGGGIISLPCGSGKTIIALYIASKLKLKTLIVVHKTFLQNQWYDRIEEFTNAKVGTIRCKKTDVEDKDIVVGMLQSISLIEYDMNIFSKFGLVIFDEIHRVPSKTFSRALHKTGAKFTVGLSATPERPDGLTKVLNWYIGDIIYKMEAQKNNKVVVKVIDYESDNKLFVEKKMWMMAKRKSVPAYMKMISNIGKMQDRNNLIIEILFNILKKNNRKIIVLSGRIDHLKGLKKLLDNKISENIKEGNLEEDEFKTSCYIGEMKEYELDDAAEADVIFASYAMAKEGLDIDDLNTLLLATPNPSTNDMVQSIGRIMRKPIEQSVVMPMIIDFNDNFSNFGKWGTKRLTYYEKQEYSIEKYCGYRDKLITIEDYLIDKKITTADEIDGIDIREKYLVYKYGYDQYELEKDMDFENTHFNLYKADLNVVLDEKID